MIAVLADQPSQRGASNYWVKLKQRLKEEVAGQLLKICQQLKLKSPKDGTHAEQLLWQLDIAQITTDFAADIGYHVLGVPIMRKFTIFTAGIMVAATVLLLTGNATGDPLQERSNAEEQVILRLLHQSTTAAVKDYYGEHRQYWRQEVLSVQKVTESPYYEVAIQVETFHGAHNPPYGLETMTFYVGPFDNVQLVNFDHQAEED